jgi:hypothetical protein
MNLDRASRHQAVRSILEKLGRLAPSTNTNSAPEMTPGKKKKRKFDQISTTSAVDNYSALRNTQGEQTQQDQISGEQPENVISNRDCNYEGQLAAARRGKAKEPLAMDLVDSTQEIEDMEAALRSSMIRQIRAFESRDQELERLEVHLKDHAFLNEDYIGRVADDAKIESAAGKIVSLEDPIMEEVISSLARREELRKYNASLLRLTPPRPR